MWPIAPQAPHFSFSCGCSFFGFFLIGRCFSFSALRLSRRSCSWILRRSFLISSFWCSSRVDANWRMKLGSFVVRIRT
uniref:Putative secreted protein n=1 Tax=Ixodes ricinus TaxID=34613 RepID=A0A6B0U5I4_IXORI